jgi:hypothetical protein
MVRQSKRDVREVDKWCGHGPPLWRQSRPLNAIRLWFARQRFKQELERTQMDHYGLAPGWRRRCWNVVKNYRGSRAPFPFQDIPENRYKIPDRGPDLPPWLTRIGIGIGRVVDRFLNRWMDR